MPSGTSLVDQIRANPQMSLQELGKLSTGELGGLLRHITVGDLLGLDDIEITDDPEADVRPAARRDTRRERREKNAPTRRQPKNEEQP